MADFQPFDFYYCKPSPTESVSTALAADQHLSEVSSIVSFFVSLYSFIFAVRKNSCSSAYRHTHSVSLKKCSLYEVAARSEAHQLRILIRKCRGDVLGTAYAQMLIEWLDHWSPNFWTFFLVFLSSPTADGGGIIFSGSPSVRPCGHQSVRLSVRWTRHFINRFGEFNQNYNFDQFISVPKCARFWGHDSTQYGQKDAGARIDGSPSGSD